MAQVPKRRVAGASRQKDYRVAFVGRWVETTAESEIAMRLLPELTPENTAFWTGGAQGRLLITHCDACDYAIHPPEVICPLCLSRAVTPRPARGTGSVYTFTVNQQRWLPDLDTPYVIAVVDLDDEPEVRLTAILKDVDPEAVHIGMRVQVGFDPHEDVFIPHFVPSEV